MTMPNFLIIGAARGGTTTLHYVLNQHPDVFMSPIKETEFFWAYGERVNFEGPGVVWIKNRIIIDLEDYEKLFDRVSTETAIGESSARYMSHPRSAQLIHQFIPEAKLIASLRQPADRAFSAFVQARRDGIEPCEDFSEALTQERNGLRNSWTKGGYLNRGFYYVELKRYLKYFHRDQMHISLFEDLSAHTEQVFSSIFKFLNVDDKFVPDASRPHNASGIIRNPLIRFLWTRSGNIRVALRSVIDERVRHNMFEWLIRDLKKVDFPPELRIELTEYYREDIEKLQGLIDRDLSHWLEPGS